MTDIPFLGGGEEGGFLAGMSALTAVGAVAPLYVQVTWDSLREKGVTAAGGGYKIYAWMKNT